jgi:metal-sulfur cluster biosynthetic enzyme
MGIVRDVQLEDNKVIVLITPTYSGCPAMHAIEQDVREMLVEMHVEDFDVKTVLSLDNRLDDGRCTCEVGSVWHCAPAKGQRR